MGVYVASTDGGAENYTKEDRELTVDVTGNSIHYRCNHNCH